MRIFLNALDGNQALCFLANMVSLVDLDDVSVCCGLFLFTTVRMSKRHM
jgi:hypothetical protein